jgi:hypothetical protein
MLVLVEPARNWSDRSGTIPSDREREATRVAPLEHPAFVAVDQVPGSGLVDRLTIVSSIRDLLGRMLGVIRQRLAGGELSGRPDQASAAGIEQAGPGAGRSDIDRHHQGHGSGRE